MTYRYNQLGFTLIFLFFWSTKILWF